MSIRITCGVLFQHRDLLKTLCNSVPSVVNSQQLKLIPLLLQELNRPGQGILEVPVVPRLEGVVEGDDGAVAGVAHHVGQHLGRAQLLGVVARHEVPHHNAVRAFQMEVLVEEHVPVGRTEQQGIHGALQRTVGQGVLVGDKRSRCAHDLEHRALCLAGILQIGLCRVLKAPDVVEGVVAHAVSLLHYHPEDIGILADVVAHHEERGLDAVPCQQVEHPGGYRGDGPVVEGEVDGVLFGLYPPQGRGVELADKLGRLFYQHEVMVSG